MNNRCEKTLNQIYDYIDKQLSSEDEIAFEKHIEECEKCKKELEEAKNMINIVNSLKVMEVPATNINFSSEIINKIKKEKSKSKVTRINFLKPIAAGVVILGIVAITMMEFSPHNYEKAQNNTIEEYAEDLEALFYGEEYFVMVDTGYPTDQYGLIEINGI